jgi:hypothetical protein
MKKFLIAIAIGTVAFAGTTSTTVPVTINYTGGCKISNLATTYDLGSIPTILESGGMAMNPIKFDMVCTSGLGYKIKVGSNAYKMVAGGTDYGVDLYLDSAFTERIDAFTGVARNGNGVIETVTLFPKVRPSSCKYLRDVGKYVCGSGAMSTTIDLTLSW